MAQTIKIKIFDETKRQSIATLVGDKIKVKQSLDEIFKTKI